VKERVNGMRNRAAEASVVFKKHQKSRAADGTISIMKHQRRLWCFLMTTLPSATVVGLWVTAPYVGHEIARANGVENRAAKCSASHKKSPETSLVHFEDDVAFCDGGGSLGRNTLCWTQVKERV